MALFKHFRWTNGGCSLFQFDASVAKPDILPSNQCNGLEWTVLKSAAYQMQRIDISFFYYYYYYYFIKFDSKSFENVYWTMFMSTNFKNGPTAINSTTWQKHFFRIRLFFLLITFLLFNELIYERKREKCHPNILAVIPFKISLFILFACCRQISFTY